MKATYIKLSFISLLIISLYSCKKGEAVALENEVYSSNKDLLSTDSISSVATLQMKDRQFIKSANVNMEVNDVYEATIAIEKAVSELNGFITNSTLQSNSITEETYNISDKDAVLIKKYQAENNMLVRIPTQSLGEFLTLINKNKVFLNSRIINAEDVTTSIKYAELEGKRIKKTSESIAQLKNTKDKVEINNNNMAEDNQQQLANLDMTDNLKYSTVEIYIKEPKLRTAEIGITNTKNIDNKYKLNFFYEVKNALIEGYYLIQKIIISLLSIWPILLIAGSVYYIIRKKKTSAKNKQ